MGPEEHGISVTSRMPPSMQTLRERIGGLKAASESELSRIATRSEFQQLANSSEQKQLTERRSRTVEASTSQSNSTHRRRSTWESELEEYLQASSDRAAALDLQDRLESPEGWLRFLQREEALRQSGVHFETGIGRLYEWATKAIPKSPNVGNEDYVRIWTGYAKQQMGSSEEDARQVFKYLKSHHIGQGLACLYEEWALFEAAAGQGQKALQKLQEGIRVQATPAGRLEELQAKLLASMPRNEYNMVDQPSPLLRASSLDRTTLQDTPSLKQLQGTPSMLRHQQAFQPSLQAIPSPAYRPDTSVLHRIAPHSTPSQQPKPLAPAERSHPEVSMQSAGESCFVERQEAFKGSFSTPFGKGGSASLGPLPSEGTTSLGVPTPSFGLGTSTLGKPGGFRFEDTAHSAAESSSLSAENGKETGYGHTSYSMGGRSSIGSSFRWQPSPTSLLTRPLTMSVSSRGVADTNKCAPEAPWSSLDENVREGATKVLEQAALAVSRRTAEPALRGREKHTGQTLELKEPTDTANAPKDDLPALKAGGGLLERHSSGGSISPTETIEVFKEGDAFQELKTGSQSRPGTPVQGAKKHTSILLDRDQAKAGSPVEQPEGSDTPAGGALASEGLRKRRGVFQEPKFVYNTPVSDLRLKSVLLERPQWMKEPLQKGGPTLSPVEETSKERASNTASSSRTGSKSSGSSSVKSAVTSKGDEETVSLSKGAAGGQGPAAKSEKMAALQKGAAEKRGGTPTAAKRGAQLKRLGLLGKAQRVAGTEDAPSSAESTEDLSPVKQHEDSRRPSEVLSMSWQAKNLPSDEELLRKMEEAASNEAVQTTKETNTGLGRGARRALIAEQVRNADSGKEKTTRVKEDSRSMVGTQAALGGVLTQESEQEEIVTSNGHSSHPVNLPRATTAATDGRVSHPPATCEPASVGVPEAASCRIQPSSGSSMFESSATQADPRLRDSAPVEQANSSVKTVAATSQTSLPPANLIQPRPTQNETRQGTPSSSWLPQQTLMPEHEQKARQEARQVPSRGQSESASGTPRGQSAREENGVFWLKGKRYQKLKCVGKGGSSKVWKVIGPDRNEFALKVIDLGNTSKETRAGFIKEIELLKKLQKRRNIIRYIDSEVCKSVVYVLLEFGEIDLANLLKKEQQKALEKGSKCVDENFMRQAWQQMLEAVHSVHQERVVHSDLKPANFLSVLGELKLIDFGIASAMVEESTCIQQRENPMGTINYMAPEAAKFPGPGEPPVRVSRPSDVWSLGCILYQMAYGQTPFAHLSIPQKVLALGCKYKIDLPPLRNPHLLDTIQRCLEYNPERRITIPELLRHPFLRPENAPVISPPLPSSAGAVAFSEQQIQSIMAMVATAAPGAKIDVQKMLQTLTSQAGTGLAAAIQAATVKAPPGAPPPPPPPPPPASKARALPRAPLQPVKRQPLAEKARPGNALQGDLAAQVAKLAAERSKRIQSAANSDYVGRRDEVAKNVKEGTGSRLIGGSVGLGEGNKENAGDYQSLLQLKLASRRRMMEEDLTGGSTATMSFA